MAEQNRPTPDRMPLARAALALAVLIAVAVVIWVIVDGDDDSSDENGSAGVAPTLVSAGELREFAAGVDHPVYWAGAEEGKNLELTQTGDGGVYVRYLDEDAEVGDPRPGYRTIGTYPVTDAVAVLSEGATTAGANIQEADDGTQVIVLEDTPTSVYFGSEDEDLQVEVFDPDPDKALDLALSGDVKPVR